MRLVACTCPALQIATVPGSKLACPSKFPPKFYTFHVPHLVLHFLERSSHRHSGAGTCTEHWGHCRRPAGSHSHGAHPERPRELAQGGPGLEYGPYQPTVRTCALYPGVAAPTCEHPRIFSQAYSLHSGSGGAHTITELPRPVSKSW